MIIGIAIMAVDHVMAWKGRFTAEWYTPGRDHGPLLALRRLVWIFLFPLLYLIAGAH